MRRRLAETGDVFQTEAATFDRLDAQQAATKPGAHLWILMVTYGLTDQEAAHAQEGIDLLLDHDHLLSVSPIACFVCEQIYELVVGKPCTGDPAR